MYEVVVFRMNGGEEVVGMFASFEEAEEYANICNDGEWDDWYTVRQVL